MHHRHERFHWHEYLLSGCALLMMVATVPQGLVAQTPPPSQPAGGASQSAEGPAPAPAVQASKTQPPAPNQQPTKSATTVDATTDPLHPVGPAGPLPEGGESEWTVWTSGRYRITPGDVIELRFPFVPELDQTLSVQPDGYITLREVGDIRAQGRTLPQFRAAVNEAYMPFVRDPVFTAVLKEFEKPYFVAAGELTKPGRYELRGATTLTQAIAYAGGPTQYGKLTEVVIFRPFTEDTVSVKQINVKEMFDKKDLAEDPLLRPGDTIYISKTKMGKLAPITSKIGLGLYFNPFQF
jgi:protein involved in polysaccharide export with SLBB domain